LAGRLSPVWLLISWASLTEWTGIGIPADQVESVWPAVLPFIERALSASPDDYSAEDIRAYLIARDMQLWAAQLDREIKSVCVTQLITRPKKTICSVLYLSGDGMGHWLRYLEQIKTWARANGANEVRITGRRGWVRQLGWQEIGTVCREFL
jgi:hypothetical protein